MSVAPPTLHLLCGKIAAGKSTLSARLGKMDRTIVIAEDDWLAALYPDQISSLTEYARAAANLRAIIGPHVASLLGAGLSVVLDFPANTVANRAWMKEIFQQSQAAHKLHYLDTPDKICIARLRARNASGDHRFAATDEQFLQFAKHFVPPSADEGFDIVHHRPEDTR